MTFILGQSHHHHRQMLRWLARSVVLCCSFYPDFIFEQLTLGLLVLNPESFAITMGRAPVVGDFLPFDILLLGMMPTLLRCCGHPFRIFFLARLIWFRLWLWLW